MIATVLTGGMQLPERDDLTADKLLRALHWLVQNRDAFGARRDTVTAYYDIMHRLKLAYMHMMLAGPNSHTAMELLLPNDFENRHWPLLDKRDAGSAAAEAYATACRDLSHQFSVRANAPGAPVVCGSLWNLRTSL